MDQGFAGRIDRFLPTPGNQNVCKFPFVCSYSWAHGRNILMGVSCGSPRHLRLGWKCPGPLHTPHLASQPDASIPQPVVPHFPPGGELGGWMAAG